MNHLKTLGARRVTLCKFHTKGPKKLGATIQNLVIMVTWALCNSDYNTVEPTGTACN
jgi:hypothetical protein